MIFWSSTTHHNVFFKFILSLEVLFRWVHRVHDSTIMFIGIIGLKPVSKEVPTFQPVVPIGVNIRTADDWANKVYEKSDELRPTGSPWSKYHRIKRVI